MHQPGLSFGALVSTVGKGVSLWDGMANLATALGSSIVSHTKSSREKKEPVPCVEHPESAMPESKLDLFVL